jgi:hypothetical protein
VLLVFWHQICIVNLHKKKPYLIPTPQNLSSYLANIFLKAAHSGFFIAGSGRRIIIGAVLGQ